ncbi:MAG: His-Xaa-Ser system radical SAM maturase HxsB [Actinomycetota bacterium]|nr:His-Xaa-Ser system radical SAM maturase HxsB [Actinomycetota bacterium]
MIKVDQMATMLPPRGWQLLPMRFHRLGADSVVLTNLVGEHVFVTPDELVSVADGSCTDQRVLARLRAAHLIQVPGETLPAELLAIKLRTRLQRLPDSTGLHIFVVTLRCEHTCRYCQVSRQSTAKSAFDMTEETARRALELAFRSPTPHLKIEFQGGEPLLNFPLIRWITAEARRMNAGHGKDLAFVIATNLALLDEEILEFCAEQGVHLSTSLDGPPDLHNGNRRRPGQDSWQQAVTGIRRVMERLGPGRLSALMTTTEASLGRAGEIIDTYADLGLRGVFLRPISPYGFALRERGGANYDVDRWLQFYEAGLDRIIEWNRQSVPMMEIYASIIAKKMLTNTDPGYVDLTSPAGIGIGALVYNYDGDIYASDEGRMLAEMGDHTFRLGNVHKSSYPDIMLSDSLLNPLTESITLSAPMCSTCAFEPYCGADPVFHHATAGDFTGHKALSAFCRRNTGVFTLLLRKMRDDAYFRGLMRRWAQ